MKVSEQFKAQYLNYLKTYLPQEIVQHPHFNTSVLTSLIELVELSESKVCEARKSGLGLFCNAGDLAEKKELDGFVRIGQLDEFKESAATWMDFVESFQESKGQFMGCLRFI